jgi:Fe-Mn family superoxide dismutase
MTMAHELPALPFGPTDLEPFLSAETIEFHHGKHHRAYVDTLNQLTASTDLERASLEDLVATADGAVFNNAAQVWNHTFYWSCLRPGGSALGGELAADIDRAFGSYDAFREQFNQSAMRRFGSGWAWLVKKADGALTVVSTANADNPMRDGATPLLTCDVWEHAYYIDYRNARARYLDTFWNYVNWEFVAANL